MAPGAKATSIGKASLPCDLFTVLMIEFPAPDGAPVLVHRNMDKEMTEAFKALIPPINMGGSKWATAFTDFCRAWRPTGAEAA